MDGEGSLNLRILDEGNFGRLGTRWVCGFSGASLAGTSGGMNPEFRYVTAPGQINLNSMADTRFLVELADPFADLVGCDPYDGIFAGVVVVGAIEHLRTQDPFLQLVGMAGEGLPHHMVQKLLASAALRESRGGEDQVQLGFDGGLNLCAEAADLRFVAFSSIRVKHAAFNLRWRSFGMRRMIAESVSSCPSFCLTLHS